MQPCPSAGNTVASARALAYNPPLATGATTMKNKLTVTLAFAVAVIAFGALAQTLKRDQLLEESGFTMRSADTPRKVARMKRLPPLQFIARKTPRGRYYLFADPKLCVCVFVGGQQAMDNFQSQVMKVPASQLAPMQVVPATHDKPPYVLVHEMGEDMFGDPVDDDILEYKF